MSVGIQARRVDIGRATSEIGTQTLGAIGAITDQGIRSDEGESMLGEHGAEGTVAAHVKRVVPPVFAQPKLRDYAGDPLRRAIAANVVKVARTPVSVSRGIQTSNGMCDASVGTEEEERCQGITRQNEDHRVAAVKERAISESIAHQEFSREIPACIGTTGQLQAVGSGPNKVKLMQVKVTLGQFRGIALIDSGATGDFISA